jgi:hypothetical protein
MNLTIIAEDKAVYLDGGVLTELDFSNSEMPNNVHSLQWKSNVGWIQFVDGSNIEIINFLPNWANSCVDIFNNQFEKNKIEAKNQIETEKLESIHNQPKTHGTIVI